MKNKTMMMLFASSLLLGACGEDAATDDVEQIEEVEEAETANEEVGKDDEPEQQPGDVVEAEAGTREIIAVNYGIDEELENGPFTITVKNAQLSQFEPSEDMVEFFDGDNLGMVSLQIEVNHDSEDTNTIYPDQGIVVTDTGHQVDAELFLSDDVGGDFHGKVTKSGDVFFFFDGNADDVTSIRYLIDSGHDENIDSFGDDLELTIDF